MRQRLPNTRFQSQRHTILRQRSERPDPGFADAANKFLDFADACHHS
jgi:hypothetical protein